MQFHPETLHRKPNVLQRTGLSNSTLYQKIAAGTFPAPVRLGTRSVAWRESDLAEWIASRESTRAA